ncbi:MAG: hypothetical protein V3T39_08105, partial [Gammaproteobacteria bacterium]
VADNLEIREQLRALPEEEPPAAAWQKIVTRADSPRSQGEERFSVVWRVSAIGLTASIVFAVALLSIETEPFTQISQVTKSDSSELEQLVNQSRVLESYLSQVQYGGAVTSVRTAGTIVELEDSIAYIDYRLNNASSLGISEKERLNLWRYRNELMQSLVTVHYAQAREKSI